MKSEWCLNQQLYWQNYHSLSSVDLQTCIFKYMGPSQGLGTINGGSAESKI